MKNFEQLLALAFSVKIIDNPTQMKLLDLCNKEYPNFDLLKEDLFQKYLDSVNLEEHSSLEIIMTFQEANKKYGLGQTTLRKNIKYGRYLDGEVRKSGGTWLITPAAIRRLYPEKFRE